MTREEAIKGLKAFRREFSGYEPNEEMFDMAIKALEQESNKSEIPTSSATKNDLGVREFEEIVVEYPPEDLCTYPEYKGKPYFSIKYKEGNDCFIGYGTYSPKVFSRYLRDYFMPLVTPQEPRKGHWDIKDNMWWICSACGCQTRMMKKYNVPRFCPACGAKMVEPQESEEV